VELPVGEAGAGLMGPVDRQRGLAHPGGTRDGADDEHRARVALAGEQPVEPFEVGLTAGEAGRLRRQLRRDHPTGGRRARPCGRRRQLGVIGQDAPLQLAELLAGFQAQLLHQHPTRPLVGLQRLRPAAAPVQRQHVQRPQPLPQRLLLDEAGQLVDHLGMAAEPELDSEPVLQRREAVQLQPGRLRGHCGRGPHIG
jgi:hypothetical protein